MSSFKAQDGTNIYYKDWGAGKPILFSHGWPLDADMWDSQLNFLAEHGYRTIAFDRRGFGRSDQPWNGNDYDTFASDIRGLIEHLDLEDVTLVGFSMGAVTCRAISAITVLTASARWCYSVPSRQYSARRMTILAALKNQYLRVSETEYVRIARSLSAIFQRHSMASMRE